ncbi:MAG: COR domain-containing protein [Haliscomenobacter sp.]|uniref:leucine-rich repeat domain-containing protein n=1 Tax=Haliscomenobacter sp. TaxID=2717303 RepID=UPI0029B19850|nr:COR domain-containing protein [Haliscomenobacter sp.]MDX2067494.1 COR domain-containing protein [Haliscomenobacter sp.]
MQNLNSLDVSNTQVTDLSPLANLQNLTSLSVSNTQVTDLSPLANLQNLNTLYVYNNQISDLSPLANLQKLTSLSVYNTPLSDLSPLANLQNLTSLYISNAQVSDLSPLANLQKLTTLYVSNTPLSDLSPLANLQNLTSLDVSYTLVSNLMPLETIIKKKVGIKWKNSDHVKGIYVLNCPLENPPREIVKQGVKATLRYLEEVSRLKQENKDIYINLREAKVLLVGQGKSGKTSLRKKLENPAAEMPAPGDTTRGIEITRLDEKMPHTGEDLRLNLWDFGGQDIQHYAHQFFLTGSSLYALITNERIQDSVHLPYWLNIVEMLGKKSPVILIQNKDGGHCQPLKDEAAIRARFGNVHNKVYQSDFSQAATEREFAELRQTIVEQASKLPHVEREYLRSFKELREKLEAEALSEKHYLRWEAYLALMPELGEDLLRDYANALTFLGVCQYFPDDALLADYVFLRPKWLIDALFELLLHPSLEATRGHFSERDTRKIWLRPEYQGMHGLLVRMMKEFELCYRVEGDGENYIIPQRLPGKNKTYGWDTTCNVPVQYRYKFMPKGVLTRLICRLHTRIEEDKELGQRVWNDAVIFTLPDGKGRFFAREVYSENTIELRATGPKHAEMLNEVIRKMDDINRDAKYENMQVEKMVPCPCGECGKLPDNERHYFKFSVLEKALEKGIPDLRCDVSLDSIKVDSIFGQSGVTKPRLKYKGEHPFESRMRYDSDEEESSPRRIFISYSKADQQHKDRLLVHLASLRDKALTWHDQDILPGEDWDESIRDAIAEADVVLYLVSAHSLAAEYIQKVELPLIEERDDCVLVPVIVDFCNWQEYDFARRNALPGKGVEVVNKQWTNEDEAWLEVVRGVKRVLGEL